MDRCFIDVKNVSIENCMLEYKKHKSLGKGVQGEVLQVCKFDNCDYAMKIQKIDSRSRYNSFVKELWVMINAQGSTPKLVPSLYQFWQCGNEGFYVMEKMDGTFEEILSSTNKITHAQVQHIIKICGQLANKRIIHGDFKADNLLVKGNDIVAIDFGYADILDCSEFRNTSPGWIVNWCESIPKPESKQIISQFNLWQLEKHLIYLDTSAFPINYGRYRFSEIGFGNAIQSSYREKFLNYCNIGEVISRYPAEDPRSVIHKKIAETVTQIDYKMVGQSFPEEKEVPEKLSPVEERYKLTPVGIPARLRKPSIAQRYELTPRDVPRRPSIAERYGLTPARVKSKRSPVGGYEFTPAET